MSEYKELYHYDNKRSLVMNEMTGDIRMMKRLEHYDENVYAYLASHPDKHIPAIYEFYRDADNTLIVLEEYIQGNTFDILINDQKMPDKQKLSYFIELLEGLSFLHSAPSPIIHRDLKPQNIMITEKGEVKILDYDAAKIYKPGNTGDTTYLGTDGIAAPEQYGFMQSDPRSDVFAVGKMLQAAFPNNSRIQQVAAKASSFDPNNRYVNARDLCDVLSKRLSPRLRLKPPFPPPGFRTGKWWKIMLAVIGYPFLIITVITLRSDNNSALENLALKLFLGFFILIALDICNSWTGLFDFLPFVTHDNRFLRYLFKFLFVIAALIVLLIVETCILTVIAHFVPVWGHSW